MNHFTASQNHEAHDSCHRHARHFNLREMGHYPTFCENAATGESWFMNEYLDEYRWTTSLPCKIRKLMTAATYMRVDFSVWEMGHYPTILPKIAPLGDHEWVAPHCLAKSYPWQVTLRKEAWLHSRLVQDSRCRDPNACNIKGTKFSNATAVFSGLFGEFCATI